MTWSSPPTLGCLWRRSYPPSALFCISFLADRCIFTSGFVHLVQEPYCDAQAGRGLRPCDALPRNVYRMKDHPLADACDVREHPMFDRIVLGTVRRVVGHTH